MGKVNDLIAQKVFPATLSERRRAVGVYSRHGRDAPAKPDDGFGWSTLHVGSNGYVSSGGVWKSKGGSWSAKQSLPYASTVVIWNIAKALVTMKRYWHLYTEEERDDINQAMAGYGFRDGSTDKARRSSPFAQWVERTSQLAPVDAGTPDGGSVHSVPGHEGTNGSDGHGTSAVVSDEQLCAAVMGISTGGAWPFAV